MCDYCGCRLIAPIADLSEEHDQLLDLAYKLRRLAEHGTHDQVLELLDGEFTSLLHHHTDIEEHGVFTQLRSIGVADTRLDQLTDEHRALEQQLEQVRAGAEGWQQLLDRLAADLSGHIVDEEIDLFPFAMYELDDTQWDSVAEVHARAEVASRDVDPDPSRAA